MRVKILSLGAKLRLRMLPGDERFAPDVEGRVTALWNAAAHRPGAQLVDGRLFSLAAPPLGGAEEMTGRFVAYRYYLAQRLEPALRAVLQVRPLGITAIVSCADGFVIGKRSASATQDPGHWEFLPAGGIEPDCMRPDGSVDPAIQLRKELRDEIGVDVAEDLKLRPLWCMIEGEVADLVFRVRLSAGKDEVAARFASLVSDEHTEIDFLLIDPVSGRPEHARRELSPSSRALLERLASVEAEY